MNEKKERELTLEELEKITAGYPGSLEEREQILPDLTEYQEEFGRKIELDGEKEIIRQGNPISNEEPSPISNEEPSPISNEEHLPYVTENERLVNELPYGELSEEELDNVIAGRLR